MNENERMDDSSNGVILMKIQRIQASEFEKLEKQNRNRSFGQTLEWAKVKEMQGWNVEFFEYVSDELLEREVWLLCKRVYFFRYPVYYIPKGLPISFHNKKLARAIIQWNVNYVKQKKGILLTIEPYTFQEEVPILLELGFVLTEMKAKWLMSSRIDKIYRLSLKEKTLEQLYQSFSKRVKQNIQIAKKICFEIDSLEKDELMRFYRILQNASQEKEFPIPNVNYFERLYDIYQQRAFFKVIKINVESSIQMVEEEIKKLNDRKNTLKSVNKIKECEIAQEGLYKKLEKLFNLYNKEGKYVDVSCGFYIDDHPSELIHLYGANREDCLEFEGQYWFHWKMIEYGINNGVNWYNFYGFQTYQGVEIPSLLYMKSGFCGETVDLAKEYSIVLNRRKMYEMYGVVCGGRWIKNKLKKLKKAFTNR